MKLQGKRLDFIRLRAEGKSYRQIAQETGISKSTLCQWDQQLRGEVDRLRKDNLEALYSAYGLTREARIRDIGETLQRIDQALAAADLSQLPPDKLLALKLQYRAALRSDYTPASSTTGAEGDILSALRDLYVRTASGDVNADQAKAELAILDRMTEAQHRTPLEDLT